MENKFYVGIIDRNNECMLEIWSGFGCGVSEKIGLVTFVVQNQQKQDFESFARLCESFLKV